MKNNLHHDQALLTRESLLKRVELLSLLDARFSRTSRWRCQGSQTRRERLTLLSPSVWLHCMSPLAPQYGWYASGSRLDN